MAAVDLFPTSSQNVTGIRTKLGNIYSEIPAEVWLKRRLLTKKGRHHFEIGRKSGVMRKAGQG